MNGLICVYSGSGNTRLACETIARRVVSIAFDLHDIVRDGKPDLGSYDMVGFATFTDFFGPPMRMKTFLRGVGHVSKPAFLLNTYGSLSGRTLGLLARWAGTSGFRVVASHSLHTPENYPPMIHRGMAFADDPNEAEIRAFDSFIGKLDRIGTALAAGLPVESHRPKLGLFRVLPALPRSTARLAMGRKSVDSARCTECGICRNGCPYGAIRLDPKPVFDEARCFGCWACYNHCPTQAIHTRRFHGAHQVPAPLPQVVAKLAVDAPKDSESNEAVDVLRPPEDPPVGQSPG